MADGSDHDAPRRPARRPIAERIAARASRGGFAERLWERWGRAGNLVHAPASTPGPQPPPPPRAPATREPREALPPEPRPTPPRPAKAPPTPEVVPEPRPPTPPAGAGLIPPPPVTQRESTAGRLRVARATSTPAPAVDSAAIRAQKIADRAPEPAKVPPPSRSIDSVHSLLGGLRDAEAAFRHSVAEIEAAKASGQARPSAPPARRPEARPAPKTPPPKATVSAPPSAAEPGMDDLLGGSGDRPKLGPRHRSKT